MNCLRRTQRDIFKSTTICQYIDIYELPAVQSMNSLRWWQNSIRSANCNGCLTESISAKAIWSNQVYCTTQCRGQSSFTTFAKSFRESLQMMPLLIRWLWKTFCILSQRSAYPVHLWGRICRTTLWYLCIHGCLSSMHMYLLRRLKALQECSLWTILGCDSICIVKSQLIFTAPSTEPFITLMNRAL